tara:strand:+ start:691 stop:1662 length:972 start_codon:yes stop_codon:yes gene_type:complete
MKKILITGATGFIGSHLTELYVKKGFKVTAFDRYNPNYNLGCLQYSKYKEKINFEFGDIRDYDFVSKVIKKNDIVIHLAALVGIPYSYISPLAYFKTNVEGTYNILEASKNHNISQVILTSTSETYGTAKYVPMDEKHPLFAQSPYAASKISADQLALSYWNSFKLPIKIIRPFNTFGPRQSSRAIIPTIILQAMNNKTIKLGNLNPTRDFLFVKDTANAFFHLMRNKSLLGEVVNVGSGSEISIKKLAFDIKKILNSKSKIIVEKKRVRSKSSEVLRLKCNNNLIKKNTNWKLSTKFKVGLIKTIDWFKNNNNKDLSKIYNI